MQELVRMTYDRARPLYAGLFAPNILDWVLETREAGFEETLLHALWLLNRWDFRTVDGDVLSGVYDKYLDPRRRRALGEVFTRPEVARHLLAVCTRGRPEATVLDPACGSGTFIVERLAMEVERLRGQGMLNVDTAATVLGRLAGLDLNPFSVSLTQMQMLWHLVELLGSLAGGNVQTAVRRLVGAIRVAGGHTSLETFGLGGAERQGAFDLDVRRGRGGAGTAAVSGLFKAIATAQYDAVVGNPPFVRAQRLSMPDSVRADYADVLTVEADLYVAFVKRALEAWVVPGGRLGFIVPLVAASADYAAPMRHMVERHRIIELIDFEQVGRAMFRGVKRPALGLVVERTEPADDDMITLRTLSTSCYDAASDELDFSRSQVATIRRSDFLLAYVPANLGAAAEADDDEAAA